VRPTLFSRRDFINAAALALFGFHSNLLSHTVCAGADSHTDVPGIKNHPNIILIALDTLRADLLGCYGGKRTATPNIDRFARDAMVYRDTFSQSNCTLPAFNALFTSRYPHHHTLYNLVEPAKRGYDTQLLEGYPTLADLLTRLDYQSVAVTGGSFLSPHFNMDKGFSSFKEIGSKVRPFSTPWPFFIPAPEGFPTTDIPYNDLPLQLHQAKKWLSRRLDDRFFLFIHSYECHRPYTPPKEYVGIEDPSWTDYAYYASFAELEKKQDEATDEIIERMTCLYRSEIAFTDEILGEFLAFLKQKNLYDDSLIIVLSDHGEEFHDHGGWDHGHTMYNELLHVPLIIKYPQSSHVGVDDSRVARLIDVMPTILFDVIDLSHCDVEMDGTPLSMDLPPEELSLSESRMNKEGIPLIAARRGDIKYIFNQKKDDVEVTVFDVTNDPGEQSDIAIQHQDEIRLLNARVDGIQETYRENMRLAGSNDIDMENSEILEELKNLGYIE